SGVRALTPSSDGLLRSFVSKFMERFHQSSGTELRAAIKSRHIHVVFLSKRIASCALPVLLSHPNFLALSCSFQIVQNHSTSEYKSPLRSFDFSGTFVQADRFPPSAPTSTRLGQSLPRNFCLAL